MATLTTKQKLEMIEIYEKEKPQLQDLADRFNVGKIEAANIIKGRDYIRQNKHKVHAGEPKRKDFFSPQGKIIDTSCYEWYLQCVEENKPVSGKLLKEKAMEIARSIQHHAFGASNGWLQKWRVRHNVTLRSNSEAEAYFAQRPNTNGAATKKYNQAIPDMRKTASKSIVKKKFGVKLPMFCKKPKRSFDRVGLEEDFDPLAFTEVSYGNGDEQDNNAIGDDDDLLLEGENEGRFKVDSFASALNAIEDLKNFSQDDDYALKYLNIIEAHFQKERLK